MPLINTQLSDKTIFKKDPLTTKTFQTTIKDRLTVRNIFLKDPRQTSIKDKIQCSF